MKKSTIFLSTLCLFLLKTNLTAQDSSSQKFKGWKTAETNHFKFVYEDATRKTTENYALYADEAWNKIAQIYSKPQDKTTVYVTGRTNTVNAFTYTMPLEIMMFDTPLAIPDFGFRENWQKLFLTHELIHIANMSFEGKNNSKAKLYGPFVNALNVSSIPGWALEGLTTVLETELTEGGRGRNPYFELYFKAPTIDNGFMSYQDIGLEKEPPKGQSYVMGYLILRSIADRWGIQTLADIQRNSDFYNISWEIATKLVTGYFPEEIYNDVRISLSKKYNKEREISEGKIISPRFVNTNYYKPAYVANNGTFITLRSSNGLPTSVVYYDPSQYSGNEHIDNIKNPNLNKPPYSETVLFTGNFPDSYSVTADSTGKIYAVMGIQKNNKMPGSQTEYALYSWTKETGLKQMTKNISLFQPSVSRDGSTLVALQIKNLQYSLVKIDLNNGEITTLLESDKESYIQPNVNSNGTKVTFLVTDSTRARVAVYDLTKNNSTYTVVANDDKEILDPLNPTWNSDDKLIYSCNKRGRLEIFEVSEKNNKYISIPVLSDPIGILWAYKTNKGILYSSFSSSGFVIKIKPDSEWNNVPNFNGPSKPGEIIKINNLHDDFNDFKPFEITKNDEKKKKISKDYIQRPNSIIEEVKILKEPQTQLQNEKTYIPGLQPLAYLPMINTTAKPNSDNNMWGFGYFMFGMTPRVQSSMGFFMFDAYYFPDFKNFSGNLDAIIPIGPFGLDIFIDRTFSVAKILDTDYFFENNIAKSGFTIPLIRNSSSLSDVDFSMLNSIEFHFIRKDTEPFSADSKNSFDNSLFVQTGLELATNIHDKEYKQHHFDFTTLLVGFTNYNKMYFGFEGETNYQYGGRYLNFSLGLKTRYTDFPVDTALPTSRANLLNQGLDCSYPGRFIPIAELIIPDFLAILDFKFYCEKLFSFGKNTVDFETPDNGKFLNWTMDPDFLFGVALNFVNGRQTFGVGYRWLYDTNTNKTKSGEFYFDAKLNWYRH